MASRGSQIHAIHMDAPVCKLRKADRDSAFKAEPLVFEELRDALALEKATFCSDCKGKLPAPILKQLQDHA